LHAIELNLRLVVSKLKPCLGKIRELQKTAVEQKWHQESEAATAQAEKLPHGTEREGLARRARQLHTASQMNEWLSSSELKPPQ